jgi:hypothetical protein
MSENTPNTASYRYTTNSLYKVPTVAEFTGRKGFVFLDPKAITAVYEDTIETGSGNGSGETLAVVTPPTKVTTVVTTKFSYYVPLTPEKLAELLHVDLVQ